VKFWLESNSIKDFHDPLLTWSNCNLDISCILNKKNSHDGPCSGGTLLLQCLSWYECDALVSWGVVIAFNYSEYYIVYASWCPQNQPHSFWSSHTTQYSYSSTLSTKTTIQCLYFHDYVFLREMDTNCKIFMDFLTCFMSFISQIIESVSVHLFKEY
jgi:hypothetical protein